MKRILYSVFGVVFGILLMSSNVLADNVGGAGGVFVNGNKQNLVGWVQSGNDWYYYENGSKITGWRELSWSGGKSWFYFHSDGVMLADGVTPDGYYVDSNGVWDGKAARSGGNNSNSGNSNNRSGSSGTSGSGGSSNRGSSSGPALSSGTNVSSSGGSAIVGSEEDCGGDFLGFRPWYKGLTTTGCQIGKPDNIALFVWTIVLNVLYDMFLGAGFTALGFIIYGGFKYLMSGGDSAKVASGKKIITAAVIGLVIALMSTIIVNTIIGVLKG